MEIFKFSECSSVGCLKCVQFGPLIPIRKTVTVISVGAILVTYSCMMRFKPLA